MFERMRFNLLNMLLLVQNVWTSRKSARLISSKRVFFSIQMHVYIFFSRFTAVVLISLTILEFVLVFPYVSNDCVVVFKSV